jgi:hypothetical protein
MSATRPKWVNPVVPWPTATTAQRTLLDATWRRGELSFQLTPSQCNAHAMIRRWERSGRGRIFCLDSGRRWGKSVLLCSLGIEDAVRYPGFRIVYIAPTYDMVKKITMPLMAQLLQTCPPQLRPTLVKSENTYVFPNDSRIELIGLDTRPDGARGTGVDKVLLDESGFFDNLEYLVVSILFPQMLGRDHARLIAASTPPVTPMHYWSTTMVPEAAENDAHDRKTLDDADQYSPEEIAFFYSQMPGGRDGVAARREYRAEHIADETLQIVPEFPKVEKDIVRAIDPPTWRDCYVALDPGFHDMSAVLFGYWHWDQQKLVIEDEIAASRMNSRDLANAIKDKEARLWSELKRRGSSGYGTKSQPFLRVSDNDPRLLADLAMEHRLAFVPTQKSDLDKHVNLLRVAIQSGAILIHPRCKKLCLHLRMGVWKQAGKLFAREGGELGHFDLIAALTYMWRNVHKKRNPIPQVERMIMPDIRMPSARPDNDNGRWKAEREKNPWLRKRLYIKTG